MKITVRTLAAALFVSTGATALLSGAAYAQEATTPAVEDRQERAIVTGRVFDQQSGDSLRGAIVRVAGTNERDVTGEDGRYQLSVPAGTSTIEVEYIGFEAVERVISVAAQEQRVEDFGLNVGDLRSEVIVVVGQSQAINQQRTADGIVNVYGEEVFGPSPDRNIGFALQRLPGLTVDTNQAGEPTGVNIRGVEGNFNSFQINGNRLASAGDRGFSVDRFSADGISNIELIKGRTPDRDGDVIGGIVNVITRSAFEREGRQINLEVGGNYRGLSDNLGYSLSANYSDIFSLGGDMNNFGVAISVGSYRIDRTSLNRDMDWVQVTPEFHPELNLPNSDPPVWFMESSHWENDDQTSRVNSVNVDLDYRTNEFTSFYLRGFYSETERENDVFETDINIDREFDDEPGGNTYDLLTRSRGRGTPGDDGSQGDYGWIGTDQDRETDLWSINFGGKFETPDRLFTLDLFYSRSEDRLLNDNELNILADPDDPYFLFEYKLIDVERGEVIITELSGQDPTDLSLVSEGELILETVEETEDLFQARIDFEESYDVGRGELTFKTGGVYRRSEAERDQTATVFEMDETFPYADILSPTNEVQFGGPKLFDVFPSRGVALLKSNPELFELNEEDTLEDSFREDYSSIEDTIAGYGMVTYRLGRHEVIAGVRYERVGFENTNFVASFLDGDVTVTRTTVENDFDFWLPGIHLRHEITPRLILRESYNRSYGRPRRDELASGRFVNEDGDIVDGNPNLRPAISDNFDIQLEYYTDFGGLYSVAVFYKDIRDFTFEQSFDFNELDENGIPIQAEDGDFEYEVPLNGTSAENIGVELIVQQNFSFLPGALSGLSARVSTTFLDTTAEFPNRDDRDDLQLPGFSDFVIAATLQWDWEGANLRADYIRRSDYVEGLGSDIESDEFFGPEQRLDLAGSYRFDNGLILFANVINVTDEPQFSYQGFEPFVEDANIVGRTYNFGLRLKLQ